LSCKNLLHYIASTSIGYHVILYAPSGVETILVGSDMYSDKKQDLLLLDKPVNYRLVTEEKANYF
jgi:hypothetical protein